MGLASALTTALTGLTAAETQIDVVGNNLANAQTIGFKESDVVFATQFLQTLSLGSAPGTNTAGTNPRQTGLGTQVAEVSPNFTQGTIEISSNPSDLAIEGDGFFIVQGPGGENLYTRHGGFKTNSVNELVSVTGNRLLGYGVDESFQVQTTELVPIRIPLGSSAVAQATHNVFLEGTLTPSGDIADTAEVIESAVLGNAAVPRPDISAATVAVTATPDDSVITVNQLEGTGGTHVDGSVFQYRLAFVDTNGTETLASDPITVTVTDSDATPNNSTIQLTGIENNADYASVKIYRTAAGGSDFFLLDSVAMGTATYNDDNSVPLSGTAMPTQSTLDANHSYLVTFYRDGEQESRPSLTLGPQNINNGRILLSNLPTPPVPGAGDSFPAYDKVRIYRNMASDLNTYYLVDTLNPGENYIDGRTDAEISDLTNPANKQIDLDGPKIDSNTLLTNVIRRNELDFENMFQEGTLTFAGKKGDRAQKRQEFTITADSTVQELVDFMESTMGIQMANEDPRHPIPGSIDKITGGSALLSQGASVQDGKIRFVSNNGVDNALEIPLTAFNLTTAAGAVSIPSLSFGSIQEAVGQSAVTEMVVYDSLGVPLNVRMTVALEERSGAATTYRWFAESGDNDPSSGTDISIGTGLLSFDGQGNFLNSTNTTVSVDRRNTPAMSPLEFDFDFSKISGLAAGESSLAASRQDGFGPGTLNRYIIGEGGVIRGVYSNGVTQTLGQVRLARFSNPAGLEQRGQNMYAAGINSGLPVAGDPGEQGIGSIRAGAVELSNTDVGRNLIDLVLATTQYRGNTRVISTAQQLFDELLNLRR